MPPLPPVTLHYPAFIPAAVYADGNEAVAAAAATSADGWAFFNKNSLITFVWPLTFVAPSCPPAPPAPPSTYPSCNYAAVAEGNLETVNKHGGRYGGPGTRPPTIKSLSGVGKTTVNWLFNHIVYVSGPVRVRRPERKQLPHPPSTLGPLLLLPPLQNYYYLVKSCKRSFKKMKTG